MLGRKKMPSDLTQRASLPKRIVVARFNSDHSGSKAEWFRTDSGTSYRLSKSKSSLSSRKAFKHCTQLNENTGRVPNCQHSFSDLHNHPPVTNNFSPVS